MAGGVQEGRRFSASATDTAMLDVPLKSSPFSRGLLERCQGAPELTGPTTFRLVLRPFTAKTGVRVPLGAPEKSITYRPSRPIRPIFVQCIAMDRNGLSWISLGLRGRD